MVATMTQVVGCKQDSTVECILLGKAAQVFTGGVKPMLLFPDYSSEKSKKNNSTLAAAWIKELDCVHILCQYIAIGL